MNQYMDAGKGLKKMFIAQIGAIACTVLAAIPIVGLIGGVGAIVFAVVSMIGLYQAGKDIGGCRTAFILTLIDVILSVISGLISSSVVTAGIFSIVDSILSFLVVYYVCLSVAEVMTGIGANDVAQKGTTVWKVNLGCMIAIIVISVCSVIPGVNVIAALASIVVAIVSIVAAVLFMIFLNKSYHALGA